MTAVVYRPDIDGLRAVAVIFVVLFHYGLLGLSGGFVGVDVFFVISGYLITSLIVPDLSLGRWSLLEFYERRMRRILPALLFVLACSAGASLFVLLPSDLRLFGGSLIQASLFVSNILFFTISNDYFAADNLVLQPLLHTWSLGVEGQFYIIYPLLLLVGRRWSMSPPVIIGVLLILSFALSLWGVARAPSATFYLLPARAWELALGGLVAVGAPQVQTLDFTPRPWLTEAAVASGLGLILFAALAYSRTTLFPGLAALLPCVGAAIIILAGTVTSGGAAQSAPWGWFSAALRSRPLVQIGRWSYALYLWHWPLLVLATYGGSVELPPATRVGLLGVSVLLAAFTQVLIERPFLRRRILPQRRGFLAAAAFSLVAMTGVGEALVLAGRGVLPIVQLPAPVLRYAEGQFDELSGECYARTVERDQAIPCRFGRRDLPPSMLVWGNSYARMWVPALDVAAERHGVAMRGLFKGKCLPLLGAAEAGPGDCAAFNASAMALITAHPEFGTVILGANWFMGGEQLGDLSRTIEALQAIGRRIVVVLAPPQATFRVPNVLAMTALRHEPPPPPIDQAAARAAQSASNGVIEALRQRYGFEVIDPADTLCDGTVCPIERDGYPVYADAGHVTIHAARNAAGMFDRLFAPP